MLNTGGRGGLGWHVKFRWCHDQRCRATALSSYQATSIDEAVGFARQPTVQWQQRYEGSQRKDLKAKAHPYILFLMLESSYSGGPSLRLGQRLTDDQ